MYHAHDNGQVAVRERHVRGVPESVTWPCPGAQTIDWENMPVPANLKSSPRRWPDGDSTTPASIGLTINGKSYPATAPVVANSGRLDPRGPLLQRGPPCPTRCTCTTSPQLVIAKDGWPLAQPYYARHHQLVAPGERYTVLIHPDRPTTSGCGPGTATSSTTPRTTTASSAWSPRSSSTTPTRSPEPVGAPPRRPARDRGARPWTASPVRGRAPLEHRHPLIEPEGEPPALTCGASCSPPRSGALRLRGRRTRRGQERTFGPVDPRRRGVGLDATTRPVRPSTSKPRRSGHAPHHDHRSARRLEPRRASDRTRRRPGIRVGAEFALVRATWHQPPDHEQHDLDQIADKLGYPRTTTQTVHGFAGPAVTAIVEETPGSMLCLSSRGHTGLVGELVSAASPPS